MIFMRQKLLTLLAVALLVMAALLLIKKSTSDYDTTALAKDEPAGSSASAGRGSLAARLKLEEVILGKRRVPDSSEEVEARARYFRATEKWISQLSIEDCVALLDMIESRDIHHELRKYLYSHYGKLDAMAAYKRVAQVESDDASMMHYLSGYVMDGWGSREPSKAWYYYLENIKPLIDIGNNYGHNYYRTAFTIFEQWAKKNPKEGYAQVLQAKGDFFESGIYGYYKGLPTNTEFAMEAKQFSSDVVPRRNEFSTSFWRYGKEWNGAENLAAILAAKWASVDADAATDWWVTWWLRFKNNAKNINEEQRASVLGLLIPEWTGTYVENQPELAIRWIYDHQNYLQHHAFAAEAVPSIAKYRPDIAMDFIKMIKSPDSQASLLSMLTAPRAPSGQYGDLHPSCLLPPKLVEDALSTFEFNEKQKGFVLRSIDARKKFEAEKPELPASDW